ncbi:hypothetical protein LC087_03305 [Bacillus carboniphilus]|uniref:Uncharacterized protein n=1 Tax=Bacillus carboniphilus TaxID=86663 RepID=A0ABY9K058_9BACI|nr:hypothetical protein [Bacillus carboniphilus]WLR43235.1 hypothetical protein LC087_03305 [Bacillus carboniphilus]
MNKKWMTLGVALLIAVPTFAFASEALDDGQTENKSEVIENEKANKGEQKGKCDDKGGQKDDMLLQLVEQYSPDTLDSWEAAMDQHKELREELKNNRKEGKPELSEEEREALKEERGSKEDKQELSEEERAALKEERGSKGKHKGEKPELSEEEQEARKAEKEEQKQLREQLKEAIESEDDEAISSVLDELLQKLEARNAHLQEKLDNVATSGEESA